MTSTTAQPAVAPSWKARPKLALLVRVVLAVFPLALVAFGAWQVHLSLGAPKDTREAIVRWVVLSIGCTIVLRVFGMITRRLVPLAVLLRMSVVFPDDVPSRFRVAMRYGTTRQLARDAAMGTLDDSTPQEAAESLLGLVTQLSRHDRSTRGHAERVRAYADMVAEEMGFGTEERQKLHWSGLIHDIGKLSVSADILNKVEPLTDNEWRQLQLHPNEGYALLEPLHEWLGEWAEASRDHHENWDGSGYPRGLSGQEISRAGRIIAVADAFDTMTSTRSYQKPRSFDDARAELTRCSGTQFDPEVVRAFMTLSLSTRRNRSAFFSWVANLRVVGSVGTSTVPGAVVTTAVAATVAAGTIITPVPDDGSVDTVADPPIEVVTTTTAEPPSSVVPSTTVTVAPATSSTTTTSTTTTTTTTTTVPVTTTAPPPPTTQRPPSTFQTGYLGGGSGTLLSLAGSVGSAGLNPDGDANPGVTIARSAQGLIEIDNPTVIAWGTQVSGDTPVRGQATIDLYVATAGFADGFGLVQVGLVQCDRPSSGCTEIASGQMGFAQTGFGNGFGEVEVYLGAVDHVVPDGMYLLVTIAVPLSSTHDVWLEFGTTAHPSQLRII